MFCDGYDYFGFADPPFADSHAELKCQCTNSIDDLYPDAECTYDYDYVRGILVRGNLVGADHRLAVYSNVPLDSNLCLRVHELESLSFPYL